MSKGIPPSSRRATGQQKLRLASHRRWHVKRGIVSLRCPLCRPGAKRRPPTKKRPTRRGVALMLKDQEVAALAQFVRRIEAADPGSEQYVSLVSLLVTFIRGIVGE